MRLRPRIRAIALLTLLPLAAAVESRAADPQVGSPAIPISDLVGQAETVSDDLSAIDATLAQNDSSVAIEQQLPAVTSAIDDEYVETQRLLQAQPTLETLRESSVRWDAFGEQLAGWQRDLTARAAALQTTRDRLDGMKTTWTTSLAVARAANLPAEVVVRVETVLTAIGLMIDRVDARRSDVLALQQRVGDQRSRVTESLSAIRLSREAAVGRVWVRDSAPLWNLRALGERPSAVAAETRDAFAAQGGALRAYLRPRAANLLLHLAFVVALAACLFVARRRVRLWVADDPSLANTGKVFRMPVGMAVVLGVLASPVFYAQPPRLLYSVFTTLALVAAVVILRPIVAPTLRPILGSLVLFYVADRAGNVVQSLPLETRWLVFVETAAGVAFLAWYLARPHDDESDRVRTLSRLVAALTVGLFAVSLVANALGYVALARFVTGSVVGSAYSGVILYVAVLIAEGLVVYFLRSKPLCLLGAVRNHRVLVRRRLWTGLRWIAVLVWVVVRLDQLSLLDAVYGRIAATFGAELRVGSIAVSLSDVALFALTIWFASLLSRLIRFVLEEDVFTRVALDRGIPYAVTTVVHYTVIIVGFLFALGAAGVDLSRFTILTGAFGVGLGLGLQGVVNNFVSGLVLLFERPVNVGDAVQIGVHSGVLRRIGLRSSVVRTGLGSEVIVPNGDLISREVVNWTLSDRHRLVEIDVGVAYGNDPRRVMAILTGVAAGHRDVLAEPPPLALFVGFGESALTFQLRAWTDEFERWQQIRSDLAVGVNDALEKAGVEIPFPRRDVRLLGPADGSVESPPKAREDDAPDTR